jgi:hypothetical protein
MSPTVPTNERLRQTRQYVGVWRGGFSRYERHISAAAMLGGFAVDNFTFGRIDRPAANIVFCAYLLLAAASIALLHALQSRMDRKIQDVLDNSRAGGTEAVQIPGKSRRLHMLLPAASQFALGGLWSGFLVFYSRSAVFSASWPFLLVLTAVFIGNEVFRRYRTRLVFSGLLLFFALYSYAIFVMPIVAGRIGSLVFLASGAVATVVFLFFMRLLNLVGYKRYAESRLLLYAGVSAILALMNLFYFTDILPPLPLALANAGVFHSVTREGAAYSVDAEPQPLTAVFNLSRPTIHVTPGQSVSVYSAVFAPIKLTTRIAHRWHWYDPKQKRWVLQSVVSFPIFGGRAGGYRGYTIKSRPRPGSWRVDIDAEDGRLIGRVAFEVVAVSQAVSTEQKAMQ